MRRIILLAITLCLESRAAEFNIEDKDLHPLPTGAASVIRQSLPSSRYSSYSECNRFVGKAVDLRGRGQFTDWVAITVDGCAWGAATAVIWVLQHVLDGLGVPEIESGAGLAAR